jgi:DNA-binding transcriptional LysR family regulator
MANSKRSLASVQSVLDWDDLRVVLAIGRTGGLSGAARALGFNHSTVFRRIGQIEAKLGARLFERMRDGYAPTAAGEAAITLAGRFDEELVSLERRLAGHDLRPSGTVRVTTTDTLIPVLAPCFAALRQAHPDIVLEVIASNSFASLSQRDAEIAVRPSLTAPEGLFGRRIGGIGFAVYGAAEYLARQPDPGGLAAHDWIAPDESLAQIGSARWLREALPEARIVQRVNTLVGMLHLARAGLGLAALPCYLGDPEPALRRVVPPVAEMASALWLLTHPDLRRVARIRAVLDVLGRSLAANADLLDGSRATKLAAAAGERPA